MHTSLFLHMGPGYNAQVEKKLLQALHPGMLFWDQPPISDTKGSFKKLVEECQKQVHSLYKQNNNNPIHIMAHSFGGHLTHQLILQCPDLISSCDLYSTGYDIPAGFLKLLTVIKDDPLTGLDLKNEITDFIKNKKIADAQKEEVWSYLSLISKEPLFYKFYWPNSVQFQKYVSVSSQVEPINMLSFQNILNDFFETEFSPASPKPGNWSGRVKIYMGQKDPLINIETETEIWKKMYPQAEFTILNDSGHFIHLEQILI